MHRYKAFGLSIHSDIALSGFAPGSSLPDITIQKGDLRVRKTAPGARHGNVVSGHIKEDHWDLDLLFHIQGGEVVTYDTLKPLSEDLLRSFVQGALLAAVLRQRHLLVLHGSAVSDGEQAIAFLGNSGWGKSTLAEYFCQRGYELITDDVMVVVPGTEAEPARIPPGVKQVRLRPHSAERLVEDYESLPLVTEVSAKRLRVLKGEEVRSIPLSKLYILQRQTADANRITPLDPQQVPLHCVAHTHATNWITDPEYVSEHFRQCAQLAKHTPVALLERILSLDALPDIYDLVTADVDELSASEQPT
ncbi:MAG: hypothetical protein AAGF99_00210 [Bacteroidota bacterium]